MSIYSQVFENNKNWVESKLNQDKDFFNKLAKDQDPDFLYIGCADSRVPANEIMGLDPGQVFVHRNVANLVVNTDLNVQSVIDYAVSHLGVRHIVVCGHYGCGGVKAAVQPADLGILNGWLREVRDVYRTHQDELKAIEDDEARHRRLVELNVMEQCFNVIKVASVQQRWLKREYPKVHGWVYDLHNGYLKDLEINFEEKMEDIRDLYYLNV